MPVHRIDAAGETVPEAARAFAATHETDVDVPPIHNGTQAGHRPMEERPRPGQKPDGHRHYFCRSNVAVPSATVAPTAGTDGGAAAVVPATVTTNFSPPVN